MKSLTRENIIENWPLFVCAGFGFSYLLINPLLESLGISALEIHYRLFVIFLLAVVTAGGIMWTTLPLGQALLGLTIMTLGFYMYKKRWGTKQATGFSILVLILFLISIGKLKL